MHVFELHFIGLDTLDDDRTSSVHGTPTLQNPLPSSVFKVAWKFAVSASESIEAFKLKSTYKKKIKNLIYLHQK